MRILIFLFDILFFLGSGYSILKYSGKFYAENVIAFKNIWLFLILYKVFFNYFFDLYEIDRRCEKIILFFRAVQSSILSTMVVVFTTFYLRNFALPRSFIAITAFLDIIYLTISRILFLRDSREDSILVISDPDEFGIIRKELLFHDSTLNISHSTDDYSRLKEIIKKRKTDRLIFSTTRARDFSYIIRLLWYARKNHVSLSIYPSLEQAFFARIDFGRINGLPIVDISSGGPSDWYRIIKRMMDILISAAVLIFLIPLLPLIAFVIKMDTEGPVFYLQERVGYKGRKINVIKFRTMVDNAEASTGPKLADINDSRITRIGRFLRRYRIDELPQFINVFIGQMSIVGPRPERDFFINRHFNKLPGYFIRTLVKPGITGLAQIYGGYYTKPEEKLKFDFIYINNCTMINDIRIMFLTAFQMATGRGQ